MQIDQPHSHVAGSVTRRLGESFLSNSRWMYMAAAVFVGVMALTPVFYTVNKQRNISQNTESYETPKSLQPSRI